MKPAANDKSGIDSVVMLSASADVAMANKKASEGAANEAQAAIAASSSESPLRGAVSRQEDAPMSVKRKESIKSAVNAVECSSEPDNIKEKSMNPFRPSSYSS